MQTLADAYRCLAYVTPDMRAFVQDMVKNAEGTTFEDDPHDAGGATKCGISLAYARERGLMFDLNGDGVVDEHDIALVTPEMAEAVLLADFLVAPGVNKLVACLQKPTFDEAVNAGPEEAVIIVQKTLNALRTQHPYVVKMVREPLREDGVIGPLTLAAAVTVEVMLGEITLVNAFCDAREAFYRALAAANPNDERFLRGWESRADKFRLHDTPAA